MFEEKKHVKRGVGEWNEERYTSKKLRLRP